MEGQNVNEIPPPSDSDHSMEEEKDQAWPEYLDDMEEEESAASQDSTPPEASVSEEYNSSEEAESTKNGSVSGDPSPEEPVFEDNNSYRSYDRRSDDNIEPEQNYQGGYYDNEYQYQSFQRNYNCFPLSAIGKNEFVTGNKIFMHETDLMALMQTQTSFPWMFQIQTKTGRVSHCGVFEFTGTEPNSIYLPELMMKNLEIEEGDEVTLTYTDLEKGTRVKIQPHTSDFLEIKDPKAVLEENFVHLPCLTAGDTITISYGLKSFYIDVLETEPANAICTIDTDCEVDFAPPLDYKEPKRCRREEVCCGGEEMLGFIPFTGASSVLGGQVLRQEDHREEPESAGMDCVQSVLNRTTVQEFTGLSSQLGGEDLKQEESKPQSRLSLYERAAALARSAPKQATGSADGRNMATRARKFVPFTGLSSLLGGELPAATDISSSLDGEPKQQACLDTDLSVDEED